MPLGKMLIHNVFSFDDIVQLMKETFPNEDQMIFLSNIKKQMEKEQENTFVASIDLHSFSSLQKYLEKDQTAANKNLPEIIKFGFMNVESFKKYYLPYLDIIYDAQDKYNNEKTNHPYIAKESNVFRLADDDYFLFNFSVRRKFVLPLNVYIEKVLRYKNIRKRTYGTLYEDFDSIHNDHIKIWSFMYTMFDDFAGLSLNDQKKTIKEWCRDALTNFIRYNEAKLNISKAQYKLVNDLTKAKQEAVNNLNLAIKNLSSVIETKTDIMLEAI